MYNIKKLVVLPAAVGAAWKTLTYTDDLVWNLYFFYRRIYVEVETDLGVKMIIDLMKLKPEYAYFNNTLEVLFETLGDTGLAFAVVEKIPTGDVVYVGYRHGIAAGYHARRAKAGFNLPEDAPADMKPDMKIYRTPPFDDTAIHDYTLTTVNGFIHNTTVVNEDVFVMGGGETCQITGTNQFGILDFMRFGKIKKRALKATEVSLPTGVTVMEDGILITIPEAEDGKSFLLVLMGYLITPGEDSFWRVGPGMYRLNLKHLDYLNKLLTAHQFINLKPLGLSYLESNAGAFAVVDAWKDSTIVKLLTLSQTFLVFVDRDELAFDKITLQHVAAPGSFIAYNEPKYPLFVGDGRLTDYWKIQEGSRWSVTSSDSYQRLWAWHRENKEVLSHVSDQLAFDRPYVFSEGHFLEISGFNH